MSVRSIGLAAQSKKLTYEQAIKNHLEELTEEQKNMELEMGIISVMTDAGAAFSLLKDCDLLQLIGLMETIKLILLDGDI